MLNYERWRVRAAQLRDLADLMRNEDSRVRTLRLADYYERLARQEEECAETVPG
jgi:hypothetical protein